MSPGMSPQCQPPDPATCPGLSTVRGRAPAPTALCPGRGPSWELHRPPPRCQGACGQRWAGPAPHPEVTVTPATHPPTAGWSLPAPPARLRREVRNEAGLGVTPASGEGPAPFVPARSSSWEGRPGWGCGGHSRASAALGQGSITHCQHRTRHRHCTKHQHCSSTSTAPC